MNVSELIARTRLILDADGSVGSGPWSDEQVLAHLNGGRDWLDAKQLWQNPLAFLQVALLATLGATKTLIGTKMWKVSLPQYVATPILLERNGEPIYVATGLHDYFSASGYFTENWISDTGVQWMPGNANDLIFRGQEPDLNTFRLSYAHRPADLIRFVATDGDVETISVAARPPEEGEDALGTPVWRDSHYVGAWLEVTSANSAAPQHEVRRVSAYARLNAYPDAQFTLESEFTEPVDEGDIVESIPQMDPLYHELICYYAAVRALERSGEDVAKSSILTTRQELHAEWERTTALRQFQSAGKVGRR